MLIKTKNHNWMESKITHGKGIFTFQILALINISRHHHHHPPAGAGAELCQAQVQLSYFG